MRKLNRCALFIHCICAVKLWAPNVRSLWSAYFSERVREKLEQHFKEGVSGQISNFTQPCKEKWALQWLKIMNAETIFMNIRTGQSGRSQMLRIRGRVTMKRTLACGKWWEGGRQWATSVSAIIPCYQRVSPRTGRRQYVGICTVGPACKSHWCKVKMDVRSIWPRPKLAYSR